MAVEEAVENAEDQIPAKRAYRTWRVQLEAPVEVPPERRWIKAHRERVTYNAQGVLLKIDREDLGERNEVFAYAGDIAAKKVTAAGITANGAQLMVLISAFIDMLDLERVAPPA